LMHDKQTKRYVLPLMCVLGRQTSLVYLTQCKVRVCVMFGARMTTCYYQY
jgi:hypothetical protein